MSTTREFRIAVFPGDGIGLEITEPCMAVVDAAVSRVGGIRLAYEILPAGAGTYQQFGTALPDASIEAARAADAILLAAAGLPDIRYPDGTEIAPQIELRSILDLYAGVRPVRSIPGVPSPLADPRGSQLDFIVVRESTEGLFVSHRKGTVRDDSEAEDRLLITRNGTERVVDAAMRIAETRMAGGGRGHVSCVDKANVFASYAFFRKIFDERVALHPRLTVDHVYIDASTLDFVGRPWRFDVIVTENMFGDILSDLGAGLIGGMGFAPSADIGDRYAVFQPCHGTAPDIAGQGRANPTAMFLSGAMMLEWLAEQHDEPNAATAAATIRAAVDETFANGMRTWEIGGQSGVREVTDAVLSRIKEVAPA
ncbi:isocitrate/isopropylmalate dehydrogenase family protein [Microbaculum sp. FT89]|uniref:isocitrate/isopropylmalate dehydrogenase family protein n=1 Tax=Microbaculum sp. FT89 TaxID=3447298 RepID=UPI003F53447E